MEYKINKENGDLIVFVSGSLDTITSPELEEEIKNNLIGVYNVIFDFKNLKYISSAGLRVLMSINNIISSSGKVILKNLAPAVDEVFSLTGLKSIFVIK